MIIIKFLALISTLVICFSPLIVDGIQGCDNQKKIPANFAVGNVYGRLEQKDTDNPYAEKKSYKMEILFCYNRYSVQQEKTIVLQIQNMQARRRLYMLHISTRNRQIHRCTF